jgi:hypothetical protein
MSHTANVIPTNVPGGNEEKQRKKLDNIRRPGVR